MSEAKKETKAKQYYPKGFIFDKKFSMIKEKKPILVDINEHTIHFGAGKSILFKKDVAVSKEELSIMTKLQINHYLELK